MWLHWQKMAKSSRLSWYINFASLLRLPSFPRIANINKKKAKLFLLFSASAFSRMSLRSHVMLGKLIVRAHRTFSSGNLSWAARLAPGDLCGWDSIKFSCSASRLTSKASTCDDASSRTIFRSTCAFESLSSSVQSSRIVPSWGIPIVSDSPRTLC